MKKLTLLTALVASIVPLAHADTVLGVYAGFGSWDSSYDGQAGEPSITLKDLGVKDHKNNYYYIALEHPVPVIPNVRLEHVDINSKQTATITKTFTIDGTTFNVNDEVTSDVDQTLPMLYGKVQFDLPFSGLSAGVEGNYVSYQGDKVTDYSAKVSYLFDSVLDVGVEAGYRKFSLTVDDDDLQAKVNLKGPYVAAIAHF